MLNQVTKKVSSWLVSARVAHMRLGEHCDFRTFAEMVYDCNLQTAHDRARAFCCFYQVWNDLVKKDRRLNGLVSRCVLRQWAIVFDHLQRAGEMKLSANSAVMRNVDKLGVEAYTSMRRWISSLRRMARMDAMHRRYGRKTFA